MAKIFISYARKDGSEIAQQLANQLRALNHEVFLDVQGIPGGTEWEKQLINRAKWCDVLILLITEASNQSTYVYNEFREAEKNKKFIIPVQVDDTPLPPHLSHLNVVFLKDNNYDGLLLKLEVAIRQAPISKSNRNILWMGGAIVGLLIVGIIFIVIMLSQGDDSNDNAGETSETPIVIDVTDDIMPDIIEDTPIGTDTPTPTDTTEPPTATDTAIPTPTATDTDIPTLTDTPTITSTRTPRPPTATPTEKVILYEEDFEDGNADKWRSTYGRWEVITEDDENKAYLGGGDWSVSKVGSTSWGNYRVELRFKLLQCNNFVVSVRSQNAGRYSVYFFNHCNSLELMKLVNDYNGPSLSVVYSISQSLNVDDWNDLIIDINGNQLDVTLNSRKFPSVFDFDFTNGYLELALEEGSSILFDDIRIWSLDSDD